MEVEENYQKEENLITRINNGGRHFSEVDEIYLEKMAEEGILRRQSGEYFLTEYGEMIKAMGYKVHLETKNFEENLPRQNPGKNKFLIVTLSFFLTLVVALLLVAANSDGEFFN